MAAITAADVKALRDRTGAAMMDCKAALAEADGNVDRAIELLRVKGQASAAKREGRGTNEGVVSSYIHANNSVGAMVEVQCETDFVSRNEDFQVFAYQVALHIAATAPLYVSTDEIDAFIRNSGRGPIDSWLTGFTFRHMLIRRALTRGDFLQLAGESRFGNCRIDSSPIGFAVELRKPESV